MVDLLDLVEEDVLKNMQKRFSDLFGFNVAFTGLNSKSVGYDSDQEEDRHYIEGTTCEIVKGTPNGKDRCYESDAEAGKHAKDINSPLLYKCQCLCSNFVIPIKVGKDVIGFIYSGQFFGYPPEDKTKRQWEALRIRLGTSKSEWPQKQMEILDEENRELDELVREGSFHNLDEDQKYIRRDFFHKLKNPPGDEVLEEIAEKNFLMDKKDEFFRIFREKSDPDHPNNRVKDVREIIKDIKILSTIANALSEECNTKYALKTYFEICQEAHDTINSVSYLYRGAKKEIYHDLETLSAKIIPFVSKSLEPSEERVKLMDDIDSIAGSTYEKILRTEASQTLLYARGINIASMRRVPKEPMKKWLGTPPQGETDLLSFSPRDQKEKLRTETANLKEQKKKILGMFNIHSALGLWVGVVVLGAIGLISLLKQFGVI